MNQKVKAQNWNKITTLELEELILFQLKALWDNGNHSNWKENHKRKIPELVPPVMIWGIGMAADDPKAGNPKLWNGLNLLGFALMEVRDRLNSN